MVDVSPQQQQQAVDPRRLTVSIAPQQATTGVFNRSPPPPPPIATAAASIGGVFTRSPPPPPPTNGMATASAAPSPAMSIASSTTTTPLVSARSVPAMSPLAIGAKAPGRGLRQKMIDELKSVRRKSDKSTPALTPMLEPSSLAGTSPPPLMLNPPAATIATTTSTDDTTTNQATQSDDASGRLSSGQLSPAEPSGHGVKARGCSICERSFTVFRAKHTCKVCGNRICDDCSKNRVKLNRRLERKKGSRLCDPCARKYVQSSNNGHSPTESPALAPQSALLARRHSVPSATLGRTLSNATSATSKLTEPRLEQATSTSDGPSTSTAHAAAATAILPTGVSVLKKNKSTSNKPHDSHLRLRHWLSLALVGTLVAVRLLVGARVPDSLLTRSLDSVLSLKLLGCYVAMLVAFDEVLRAMRPREVAPVPVRRRRRTRSKAVGVAVAHRPTLAATAGTSGGRHTDQDDDVLEVDTGDTVVETGFSLEKLIVALDDAAIKSRTASNELELRAFLASCEAICVFVLVFGRATSFAGSTVAGYITSIHANLAAWPLPQTAAGSPESSDAAWARESVRAIVEREVSLQIASVGGKKKPSCSRCVLRLLWFVEFVEACLKYTLIESMDENCSPGASKAYEETIGSRHPWIIRKGVNSALGSIPTRSAILADLNLASLSPDDAIARLKVGQTHLRAIVAEIHQVLKKHDLLDIK